MGSRARKKWQGDLLSTLPNESDDDDESSTEEESKLAVPARSQPSGFALMMDDDDDDNEEEDASDNDDDNVSNEGQEDNVQNDAGNKETEAVEDVAHLKDEEAEEEDLDAILDEFQQQDLLSSETNASTAQSLRKISEFAPILHNIDTNSLDVERSLASALHGATETAPPASAPPRRRGRIQTQLFGSHPSNTPRPPHYVGGGIGLVSYDRLNDCDIPWPYEQSTTEHIKPSAHTFVDRSRWYTFQYSDTYANELSDYRQIQQSGDVNALLLFVSHHPYCTAALAQLVSVLKQTNHANEAQQLLKRCLWVYECAMPQGFHKDFLYTGHHALMDSTRPENEVYFQVLWELVRHSMATGLHKSAWSIGRYLWGLDPWRDPMGVLLVLDVVALSCQTNEADEWIIQVVQDEYVRQLWYDEFESNQTTTSAGSLSSTAKLDDMPNWSFSYALALFRVHGGDETSNSAIQKSLRRFPGVVGSLLQKLEVDTTGRSFRRDWLQFLDKETLRSNEMKNAYLGQDDTILTTAALQAQDFILSIFLERQTSSWGDDDVLQWLYDNLAWVLDQPWEPPPMCYASIRYTRFKASHYETRVQQLPQDANIIDGGLLAHAMVVDPNRGRLLRRHRQQQQHPEEAAELLAGQQAAPVLGGPPTGIVNPDWPIAEVFWRSLLPWNHVEGVAPPRR